MAHEIDANEKPEDSNSEPAGGSTAVPPEPMSRSQKTCLSVSLTFLVVSVLGMFGAHHAVYKLFTEHYIALAVMAALGVTGLASCREGKLGRMVFNVGSAGVVAGLLFTAVAGWVHILQTGKIGGNEFAPEAIPSLAACLGVAAVAFCLEYHDRIGPSGGYKRAFNLVASPIMSFVLASFTVLIINGIMTIESRIEENARKGQLAATEQQLKEIGGGTWRCTYDGAKGAVTCREPRA
jgi:hypothetical protein